ncbi:MAG: Chromosomal replication initiator protein DnaA [Chlamydiae bacterium]|nr:Chromosomal replication initiator protein DnaA [Chlamydiota bacterium]
MARRERVHSPGRYYHVILRGNDGHDIFFCPADRLRMCLLIQEGVERYDHHVHAFCFMSNHIHLLIEVDEVPLSKVMQNIAFRYALYINHKYDHFGHLFHGRFKSIILDEEGYFLRLLRYIHLNPVRAGIVKDPKDYLWSSHRCYLGADTNLWITTSWGLSKFSSYLSQARELYLSYIRNDSEEKKQEIFQRGLKYGILGDKEFVEKINLQSKKEQIPSALSLEEIEEVVCDHFKLTQEELRSSSRIKELCRARASLAYFALKLSTLTIKDIAAALKRDASSLSRSIQRYCICGPNHDYFKNDLEKIKEKLSLTN